jgi:thiamine biosynthesis lipoprotein
VGVRVVPVMGTVVSIDVRDPDPTVPSIGRAVDDAVAWLHEVDARFSPFRATSEIRRLDRGELDLDACHPDVRHVLRACEELRAATGGAFDARGHDPAGRLDPSGFVKGWAVDEAVDLLVAAGARSFAVNAGGDVVVRGEAWPGRPWRVGVRDPAAGDQVAAVLEVVDRAVATSGLYERGGHVRDPRTGRVPDAWASITVVARTLGVADAWATAALALGPDGPTRVAAREGLGVLAIDHHGIATWSDLVDGLLR